MKIRVLVQGTFPVCCILLCLAVPNGSAGAQSLTWDGPTGALFAPYSHVTDSPSAGFGRPTVAFHLLDAGSILGTHFQTSLTIGYRNRVEVGLTRSSVSSVGSEAVASLFDRGFTTLHAKVKLMADRPSPSLAPEISAGAVFRWQKEHIGADIIPSDPTQNGDVYLVATKTLALSDGLAILANAGARATNASFFGVSGNTPTWELRAFASGGFLLADRLMLGGEFVQQPAHLDGFSQAEMPSTVAIFAKGFPTAAGRFNLDLAVVRIAGKIGAGLDLKAENRLAAGGSYRF